MYVAAVFGSGTAFVGVESPRKTVSQEEMVACCVVFVRRAPLESEIMFGAITKKKPVVS